MPRAFLLALTTLAASTAAQANPVTYHYEASPWVSWAENSGHGFATYANPTRSATLDFTLAAPLTQMGGTFAPVNVTAQLLSWAYDGGQASTRVDSSSAMPYFSLYLWTDAAGGILQSQFYIHNAPVVVAGLPVATPTTMYVDSGYIAPGLNASGYLQERVDYPGYLRCQGYDLHMNPYCYAGSEGGYTNAGGGAWTMTALAATDPANTLPEPGGVALALAALGGLAWVRRRC